MSEPLAAGTVTVNQRDAVTWHPGMTVSDLLTRMGYTFPRVIVTIDGHNVPHDSYADTLIPAGADVRVIHLMAGG